MREENCSASADDIHQETPVTTCIAQYSVTFDTLGGYQGDCLAS